MISAKEAGEKWHGLMRTEDLKGALWLPGIFGAAALEGRGGIGWMFNG